MLFLRCMNSVFRRFLRYIPRQALIVYRLIDTMLIKKFISMIPFYFEMEILPNVAPVPRYAANG